MKDTQLKVENLSVHYKISGHREQQVLKAVSNVSLELHRGETLGIVGETGCGKSSLGKAILQLVPAATGRVIWQGQDLCTLSAAQMKPFRKDLQLIFQDPISSLNPRMTVGEIIAEPLRVHSPELSAAERNIVMVNMIERVGLLPEMAGRYPNEFSGGQCQRISIARAMILNPRVIVCDEPVSALDVSIQAQICNLLRTLQRETGVSLIFISHDLSIIRYMCHRVLVMYLGQVMENSPGKNFFTQPRHPYSRALINAVPKVDLDNPASFLSTIVPGELPSPVDPPSGCVFRTRCTHATPQCVQNTPVLEPDSEGTLVACHRWKTLT